MLEVTLADGLRDPIAEGTWSGRDVRDLFKQTGEPLGTRRVVDARRASTMTVGTPYTVQLLAVKSRASAERFATAINGRAEPLDVKGTFYSAGGYPATHPAAHVLSTDASGRSDEYTRVVAGAFLDEQSARAAATDLAQQGLPAFARRL
jgi:SPOR domain